MANDNFSCGVMGFGFGWLRVRTLLYKFIFLNTLQWYIKQQFGAVCPPAFVAQSIPY